jgi:hypothetical protein
MKLPLCLKLPCEKNIKMLIKVILTGARNILRGSMPSIPFDKNHKRITKSYENHDKIITKS